MNAPRDFDRPRRSRIATAVAFAFVLLAAVPGGFATAAPQSSSSSSASSAVFSSAELDQMLAPIALYPDSLLAQVLMASTYPGEVADAAAWSKANPNAKGDDAVKQVAGKSWDPSVQALVAFPQVLSSLSQSNDWVTRLGDAFLAEPDRVMASVQRLRAEAQKAGTLKSSEQQTVKTESVTGGEMPTAIVIESNDPDVIYVPSYDPTWAYPGYGWGAYPPYYYPPGAYWYPGAALGAGIMFGIGVGIIGGLWGDCNWGGGDIDIDVDRYNNFERNVNREANRGDRQGNRDTRQGDRQANRDTRQGERQAGDNKFRHDSAHREGTPYRDQGTRNRFEGQRQQGDNRFRGDDAARSAQRDSARQSMDRAGMERPARTNADAQNRARATSNDRSFQNRQSGSPPGSGRDSFQQRGQTNAGSRDAARNSGAFNTGSRGDAFSGASGGMRDTGAASSRGRSSSSSMSRGGGSYGGSRGGGASRSMSRPPVSRGGGGRRR